MINKSTGILVIIFLILGIYVYLFEVDSGNREDAIPAKVEKVLDFNIEDVLEIVIRDNSQGVLLQKTDGQWKIKQPAESDVAHEKVSDILAYFDYGIIRVIDENPADISLYGLDRPRYAIGVKVAADESFQTLIIGDDAPGNLSCYGKVRGQPRVLLLGVRYRQEFDRVLKAFLNR